ncbi:MAG TPA: UDP-forming cellulose synthase catalytic subunit [Terracidiphilus sp.]
MNFAAGLIAPVVAAVLAVAAWLPMTWQQQLAFGAVVVVASVAVGRIGSGRRITHLLMLVSICVTMRYAWFRISTLYHYLHNPWSVPNWIDASFMVMLLSAELYSFLILLLGYMQGIAPLQRKPEPLPKDISLWPSVDIFIPTYNEPLELVRTTALAATAIDWPADRLRVVILDDGEREEFRKFAEEAGVTYVARTEHTHAKAGNINHALRMSDAEFVAIFDSDHIPTRSFLQMTVGWFLRDPKLGMLQTPHHFYSPDPVERNLDHFRVVPNEGELFYGVIQDGNDLWNATFFCGSCAVIRRAALEEVGGIAVETVTEDAHTSLRMQMKGWNTAYLNTVQAAGLATESVSGHVRQRTRWARGMIQILRTDNPLFARGLKPAQRLCYLNAMLHFMYAAPRLIFLASPLLYLVFGKLNMPGYWLAILVFAGPHLVLSTITNSRIQGHKRHTFWNEVYETILSPYILFPTWLALINPRYGKFDVTLKGSQQDDHFDTRIGWPFLIMLMLNVAGLALAIPRYLYWNVEHRGTVLMNVMWAFFNILILGVTVAVCYERKQRRGAVRIAARIPVKVIANGTTVNAFSENVSSTGMALVLAGKWAKNQEVSVVFSEISNADPIRVRVTGQSRGVVRVHFGDMSIDDQLTVTRVIYSRADRWLDWNKGRQDDHLLRSFARVFAASLRGLSFALMMPFHRSPKKEAQSTVLASAGTRTAALLLLAAVLLPLHAFGAAKKIPVKWDTAATDEIRYPVAGSARGTGILLNQQTPDNSVRIVLPSTLMIEQGQLSMHYTFPAGSRADAVTVQVMLNGNVIAALTPTAAELASGDSTVTLPLPVDVFVQDSKLSFELASARQAACSTRATIAGSSWVRIDPSSNIEVHGRKLSIADDLSLLPEPFVRGGVGGDKPVPFVFAATPDWEMLRAAGIAASWFGVQAQDRGPRFEVKVAALPKGNVVLFLTGSQQVDTLRAEAAPSVSILPNPADAFGKMLVFNAPTEPAMVDLVQSFAAGQMKLEGARAAAADGSLPAPRVADDAPAWVQGNRIQLGKLAGSDSLRSSAKDAALMYLRFAPDLNFGPRNDAYLSLRYTAGPNVLAPASNIAVSLNGLKSNSVPMHAGASGATQTANIPIGELPFLFRNTLTARLYPVANNADPCAGIPSNFQGSISGGSFIDLANAAHLARLPDLRMFSNAGFPFTRFADLSQTAILLPQRASAETMALYLDMLGYFGSQTGYPALRVSVASAESVARYADKDLLLIGSYIDAAQAVDLTSKLTARPWVDDASLSTRASLVLSATRFLRLSNVNPANVENDATLAQGIIEASKSPFGSGRSLVAVLSKSAEDLAPMSAQMLDAMPLDDIRGSASLWSGGGFHSYELSAEDYLVGDASIQQELEFWMALHPWLPALLLVAVCALAAIWIQGWVIYRRRLRLEGVMNNQPIGVQ